MARFRRPLTTHFWPAARPRSRSADQGARPLLIYADTSFFVSLYLADRHSAEAHRRLRRYKRVWLTPLHRAEWTHAVLQHVFHRHISRDEAQKVLRSFEKDRQDEVWAQVDLPEMLFEQCLNLARKHVPALGVRTLDTLHVACALELQAAEFWTFDERQTQLAKAVGL